MLCFSLMLYLSFSQTWCMPQLFQGALTSGLLQCQQYFGIPAQSCYKLDKLCPGQIQSLRHDLKAQNQ